MRNTGFHTDYWVWATAAICLFIILGFLDPLAGATWKGDSSFWNLVGIVVRGEYTVGGRMLPCTLQG
jgi:hypothetical protein